MSFFNKQDRLNHKLRKAIDADNLERVKELVQQGAQIDVIPGEGYMAPLYRAIQLKKQPIALYLLSKGANTEVRHNNYSPLSQAIKLKQPDVVEALLKAGADVNALTASGLHPVQIAVEAGNADIMRIVLRFNPKLSVRDAQGNTALHLAALKGNAEMAKLLVEAGADKALPNNSMNTPADVAERTYPRLAAMLRDGLPAPDTKPAPAPETSPAPQPAAPAPAEWKKLADDEVARIVEKQAIGYRLTEVFNFGSKLYTQIAQNMATGQESQTVKHFGDLGDSRLVGVAQSVLESLGGHAPGRLNKPSLPQPGGAS